MCFNLLKIKSLDYIDRLQKYFAWPIIELKTYRLQYKWSIFGTYIHFTLISIFYIFTKLETVK